MREICGLDSEGHRGVTPEMLPGAAGLTGERIAHIQKRHPLDFGRYSGRLKEIAEDPDDIINEKRLRGRSPFYRSRGYGAGSSVRPAR